MTYEEAIKILEAPSDLHGDAIEIAIEGIKRQIPKKPVKTDLWEMCPTCYEKYGFDFDILVGMRGLKTGLCYCLNCGQRIDCSEV